MGRRGDGGAVPAFEKVERQSPAVGPMFAAGMNELHAATVEVANRLGIESMDLR